MIFLSYFVKLFNFIFKMRNSELFVPLKLLIIFGEVRSHLCRILQQTRESGGEIHTYFITMRFTFIGI